MPLKAPELNRAFPGGPPSIPDRNFYLGYNTRSKKLQDTSFAHLTTATKVTDNFEFSPIEHGYERKNSTNDGIMYSLFAEINDDLQTFKQAMKSKERDDWERAVNEELNSMDKNNVWTIVNRPQVNENGQ